MNYTYHHVNLVKMILMKFSQIISKKLICFKHGQHSKIYCVIKFLCQALL